MKKFLYIVLGIMLCFISGIFAGWLQSESIATWYPTLVKSTLTPAAVVFPVAWGVIYVCMGTSAGIVWGGNYGGKRETTVLFAINLILNFLWSICFFVARSPLSGLVCITAIYIAAVWYFIRMLYICRGAAFLLLPYIAWLTLATYLNACIVGLN